MEKKMFNETINLLMDGESICLSDKKLADALDNLNYLEAQCATNGQCYTGDAIRLAEPIRKLIYALSEDAYLYNVYLEENHESKAAAT